MFTNAILLPENFFFFFEQCRLQGALSNALYFPQHVLQRQNHEIIGIFSEHQYAADEN
jgi:hypothetical protein